MKTAMQWKPARRRLVGWLLTVAGAVVAGMIVIYLTREPAPPAAGSFLERVSGTYALESWEEKVAVLATDLNVTNGTLEIVETGAAEWRFDASWLYVTGREEGTILLTGHVLLNSQTLQADRQSLGFIAGGGGRWPNQDRAMFGRAGDEMDDFTLTIDEQRTATFLHMENSVGIYVWRRCVPVSRLSCG